MQNQKKCSRCQTILPIIFGLNGSYFLEHLHSMSGSHIEMRLVDAQSPVIFVEVGNAETIHTIMTMRIF